MHCFESFLVGIFGILDAQTGGHCGIKTLISQSVVARMVSLTNIAALSQSFESGKKGIFHNMTNLVLRT